MMPSTASLSAGWTPGLRVEITEGGSAAIPLMAPPGVWSGGGVYSYIDYHIISFEAFIFTLTIIYTHYN